MKKMKKILTTDLCYRRDFSNNEGNSNSSNSLYAWKFRIIFLQKYLRNALITRYLSGIGRSYELQVYEFRNSSLKKKKCFFFYFWLRFFLYYLFTKFTHQVSMCLWRALDLNGKNHGEKEKRYRSKYKKSRRKRKKI